MARSKTIASAGLKLAAVIAAIVPAVAHAGYVNDRRAWLALTPEARAGYVQGMADSLNYIFSDDSLSTAIAKRARNRCLAEQRTTVAILADRITTGYKDDRFSGLAPTAIYFIKMQEACKGTINQERAGFGLAPIP